VEKSQPREIQEFTLAESHFWEMKKTVDVEKTIRALKYFASLNENPAYNNIANQGLAFYQ